MLTGAYNTPYVGSAAQDFLDYLRQCEEKVRGSKVILYAKALSVVQSSGTGKSRMLTEVR